MPRSLAIIVVARIPYPGRMDIDGDDVADAFDRGGLQAFFAGFGTIGGTRGSPLAVTEFGVHRWARGAARFMGDQMDLLERRGVNHMLWEWQGPYRELVEEVNAFNFRFGPNPESHKDVAGNPLEEVIGRFWARNKARPSNTPFH